MNDKRLKRAARHFWDSLERSRWEYGTLGRLNTADGSYTLYDETRPGFVHVRMDSGNMTIARDTGKVPLRATLPVRMRREAGVLVLDSEDTSGLLEGDTGSPSNPYGVPAHPISVHTDVTMTSEAAGNVLKYDGTDWINSSSIPEAIAATIEAAADKTTPVDADDFGITDSAASNVLKKLSFANLATWIMGKITALTTKATPVGADAIVITDSAASDVPKRLTFTNLATYLTTLYMDLTTAQTVATGIKTFTPGIVAPSVDGSIIANGDLTLQGTTHATRTSSNLIFQPNGGWVGQGTTTPGIDMVGTFDFDPATSRIFQVDGPGARLIARGTSNVAFDFIQTDGASNAKWFLMQLNNGTAQFISLSDAIAVQKNLLILDLVTGNAGFGVTAPSGKVSIQAGSSADHANAGGVLAANVTTVGNVGTGEDNLMSFSIPANTLAVNGQSIWFEATFRFTSSAISKTLRMYFGATVMMAVADLGGTAIDITVRGRIIRTGAATQRASAEFTSSASGSSMTYTTPAETLSGAVVIKGTGQATNTNEVTMVSMIVGWDDQNS